MKIREIVMALIALLAISAALWSWYHPKEVPGAPVWLDGTVTLTRTKYLPAKLETPDCTVQTVDKDRDKKPDIFAGGLVTAEGETPKGKTGYDIKTTITPSSGETRIYVQPKPLPLFGFEDSKELGLRYGFKSEVDVFGRWTFLRVGSVYGALYSEASVMQDRSDGNIMFEVSYRW